MSLKKTSTIEMLDGAFLITAVDGKRVKVSSYGDSMIRLQLAREGEPFYSDDHYEMVEHHDWTSDLTYTQDQDVFVFSTAKLRLFVDAHTLQSQFYINGSESPVLKQIKPANWHNHQIKLQFDVDANEHFTGLGHGYYARAESIDLKNQVIQRNYGLYVEQRLWRLSKQYFCQCI
jgi:alpha-D-xyloside xylohydrolase